MKNAKEAARSAWRARLAGENKPAQWGRAAEKLRGLQPYRDATTVFASPAESLQQARINCLTDGKNLLMPAPSLREGFFLLPARTIPFREISMAVTYRGLAKNGQLLAYDAIAGLSVELLLTDALAIDLTGGRLGDGHGFFDICCALLQELGGLAAQRTIYALVREEQLSPKSLPREPWDIEMTGAVTPAGIHAFEPPVQRPRIFWEALATDRIRRIDPLWKLYRKTHLE